LCGSCPAGVVHKAINVVTGEVVAAKKYKLPLLFLIRYCYLATGLKLGEYLQSSSPASWYGPFFENAFVVDSSHNLRLKRRSSKSSIIPVS
jgi:hypothetical protein